MSDILDPEWDYFEAMRQYDIQQRRACEAEALVKELLEALTKMRTVVGARGCTNKGIYVSMPGEYCGMIDNIAKAAIAKAKGE